MTPKTCTDCKGTGYWCNYPPPPGYVLDMGDCCGVCCGTGVIRDEPNDVAPELPGEGSDV